MIQPLGRTAPCLLSSLVLGVLVTSFYANAQEPAAPTPSDSATPHYKDAALPISDRVADLLSRMTLDEKVYQLTGGWEGKVEVIDPTGTYTNESARKTLLSEWGTDVKFTPRNAAILRNAVQRWFKEKTR